MPALDYSQIADIYDLYVRTDADIPFFLEYARRANGPVLELMCGTGRVSLPLAEAGIPLTCVDSSQAMLSILRTKLKERHLTIHLIRSDVTHLSLPETFALVIIPFNSFSELQTHEQQLGTLRAINTCLARDGRLIVTLHNPAVRKERIDGQLHVLGTHPLDASGNTLTLQTIEALDPHTRLVSGH